MRYPHRERPESARRTTRRVVPIIAIACLAAPVWGPAAGNAAGAAPNHDVLAGVSCATATSCFAVGNSYTTVTYTARTLTERWDGRRWSKVPSPNSPGGVVNQLTGVSCTGASNCFAVGSATTNSSGSHRRVLIERWNGKAWSIMTISNPTGDTNRQLTSVSCSSATSCFAVGLLGSATGASVERWDGKSWSSVASRDIGGGYPAVGCASATSCFAVAERAERWNGKTWTVVPTPKPDASQFEGFGMNSVSCSSATTCLVVGVDAIPLGDFRALTERWNGKTWSRVPGPYPGGNGYFNGVSCISSADCVAVGAYDTSGFGVGSAPHGFIDHWDGTKWSAVASPDFGKGYSWLAGVSCPTSTSCFAVGYVTQPLLRDSNALIEHWDGTAWSKS